MEIFRISEQSKWFGNIGCKVIPLETKLLRHVKAPLVFFRMCFVQPFVPLKYCHGSPKWKWSKCDDDNAWCSTELHHPKQTLDPERGIIKPPTGHWSSDVTTCHECDASRPAESVTAWQCHTNQATDLHRDSEYTWLCAYWDHERHRPGGVIRSFVLVSPFFLWSLWPRARSQVLRMLRIYLAIRELANIHPAAVLHFALLQLHRCMHVIYDVLTIIWNAGNVTRSLLISLKGMKQTSMIRYSGWHKIMYVEWM